MATVSMGTWTGDGVSTAGTGATYHPYVLSRTLNVADIVTKKGSGIAASDVIEVLNIPAGTLVVGGWIRKDTAITGTASALTLSLGITGVSAAAFLSAFDYFAASTGAYATLGSAPVTQIVGSTADTVDLLVASLTGTWTGGNITVSVVCIDADKVNRPGLAALKS